MSRQTIQNELASINQAITTILETGQSATISTSSGTRQVTMASLNTLYQRKAELEKRLRGGPKVFKGIPI
ncbi:hypothetical protein [Spartinivicinus poritis]|uniref:Uncharacterized protein n=1 Tax=Spartinivicinus poritis TaxID=2994640 RepID=A0ABT5UEL0_9GAMM|nr:hypothetical protein [Spartinivicinus sp. A2-2]MDE1464798.1 hypothetical protein [Spartinivicinus sp. A2-2]